MQHLARGLVKGWPRAQRVVGVRCSLEHGVQQLRVKNVLRIGEVRRYFLLDGASLLFP